MANMISASIQNQQRKGEKMKKTSKKIINIKIIIAAIAILLFAALGFAFQYSHYGSLLLGGTFNNTLYNASGQFVHLNFTDSTNTSYVSNGTYISPVIDLGANTSLKTLTWRGKPRNCHGNMSYIDKFGGYCIDQYEASMPNSNDSAMGNATEIANRNNPGTMPAMSKQGVVPWVEVSANSARTACTNAGKHLCTSKEWLGAANILGQIYNLPTGAATASSIPSGSTDGTACNTYEAADCDGNSYYSSGSGDACDTGNKTSCVSAEGVYDLVGNVWEWTNETVTAVCPCSGCASNGYCYPSDNGWYSSTNTNTTKYGNDGVYFLAGTNSRAVLRGGTWHNGANAGVFAVYLHDPPGTYYSIGFRCCSAPN